MFQIKPLPRTLRAALADTQNANPEVRAAALADLVRLSQTDDRGAAIAGVRQVLLEDPEAGLRAQAATALADCAAGRELPALLKAWEDAHARVKQMVLVALGELSPRGHKEVCNVISSAARSPLPALRFQALVAGHKVCPHAGSDQLREGLRDEDPKIRYLALRLIDAECWLSAEQHGEAVALVKRALADTDAAVRVAAAMILAPLDRQAPALAQSAKQELARALNGGVKLPEVEDEQHLIELVGELAIKAALPGLRRHAYGRFGLLPGRFAWQAKIALARLGDESARRGIERGLWSFNRDTRVLAVVACGLAGLVESLPELEKLRGRRGVDEELLDRALRQLRERKERH